MKVSKYLCEFCKFKNIKTVYHMIGGMTVHLIDALEEDADIKVITMHHEQGAAFAADAHARITNKPSLVIATSGPGATNLLTGIADCYFDHIPAIFLCGQVNTSESNKNLKIRQLGFQETDIVNIARPITKFTKYIERAEDFPRILAEAYDIALEPPFGPVLLDLPMDIQRNECDQLKINKKKHAPKLDLNLTQFIEDLKSAHRPLLLIGHGVRLSGATSEVIDFAQQNNLPMVHSLHGTDCATSHLNFGLIGTYGNRYANIAIMQTDFLLVLGSRLDIRQTGAKTEYFEKNKIIYHVDILNEQVNNRLTNSKMIIADIKNFIQNLRNQNLRLNIEQSWLENLKNLKDKYHPQDELKLDGAKINPNAFLAELSNKFINSAGYTCDVGKNQMWAGQSLNLSKAQRVLFSGGLGAMGFSLPAAVGMALATNKQVISINGDGGFQMNIQELQSIIRYKLDIKIIVINNESLGMVQQFQEDYFDFRLHSTAWNYDTPNFIKIANAYGLDAKSISKTDQVKDALDWLYNSNKAALLECKIDNKVKLFPKVAFGNKLDNMHPHLD